MDNQLLTALQSELGSIVRTDAEIRRERRHDYWAVSHLRAWRDEPMDEAAAVVQVTEVAQVQQLLRFATANRINVMPFGLGSGVCGGVLPSDDVVLLDLSTLCRTREIDEHNYLASFDAGKNGLEAEEEVAARGLTIGHWPQSIAVSSVGGWVSTRASGQFSTAYGNIEDIIYSIEAVLPNGELVVLGKAPRAAAGPDLRHVLMGAEGTMGVITGVTFSLRAAPPTRKYSAFYAPTMEDGMEAQRRIVAADWRPPVMRQYDHPEVARNFGEHARDEEAVLMMVHEGPTTRVDAEIADITLIALEAGLTVAAAEISEIWMGKRNHVPTWSTFFERGLVVDTIEVSAKWSQINDVYRSAIAALQAVDGVLVASAHSSHVYRSGINLYFTFVARTEADQMERIYFECWKRVMEATAAYGGGVAHHHGSGRLRKNFIEHDLGATGIDLLRTLKAAVDPHGIMNPGNLLPDLPR